MEAFTIPQPDNFHVHLRAPRGWAGSHDHDQLLEWAAPISAASFRRALVMPNVPRIVWPHEVVAYRDAILRATEGLDFEPLMTAMLVPGSGPLWARGVREAGAVACKLYPRGAMTGPDHWIWDRGDQIAACLRDHPEVTRYVVIDDGSHPEFGDPEMGISRNRLRWIWTDGNVGLTDADVEEAIAILNGSDNR